MSLSDSAGRSIEWEVVGSVGPVFSSGGLKNCILCLAKDAIIGVPLGVKLSVAVGLAAGAGWLLTPYVVAEERGARLLRDEGDPSWRRYYLDDLEAVSMKKPWFSMIEIRLKRKGAKVEVYGLYDRTQVKACRGLLHSLYEDIYSDRGFNNPPTKLA